MRLILAVLALLALLIPVAVRHQRAHQLRRCQANLSNYATALEMYSTDWQGRYPSRAIALVPHYLRGMPLCPVSGSGYRLLTAPNPDRYTVICPGNPHGLSVPGWPRKTSTECYHDRPETWWRRLLYP